MLESFDTSCRSFSISFNSSILPIANLAGNMMHGRGALRKETITDTLHLATYQKFSSNSYFHKDDSNFYKLAERLLHRPTHCAKGLPRIPATSSPWSAGPCYRFVKSRT